MYVCNINHVGFISGISDLILKVLRTLQDLTLTFEPASHVWHVNISSGNHFGSPGCP